jgi:hypothetical protein
VAAENPCFAKETTTACRLTNPAAVASAAFDDCFNNAQGNQAERVLMANLVAGDLVLSAKDEIARVVVNQHMPTSLTSPTVTIQHATGSISLTPDHVIFADGEFVAAREVKVGSVLSQNSVVSDVVVSMHTIINPLTTNSRILAAGVEGQPVEASTHPEWIASFMLSTVYPLPVSLSAALSYLFPAKVQAFYDAVLEPFNNAMASSYAMTKSTLPTPALLAAIALLDLSISAGFAAYSLASVEGLVALVAVAAALKASRK